MASWRGGWNGLLSYMLMSVCVLDGWVGLIVFVGKEQHIAREIKAIYSQDERLRSNGISLVNVDG